MPHNASSASGQRAPRAAARAERWDLLFEPGVLAAAGALASLAFLFQPRLDLKLALCLAFLAAALASGKKVSLPTALFVSLGIAAANLLVPVGRVLWRLGPLVVTETALLEGIERAATFEGLMFISKASIRRGLRLPGRFGSVVASAFSYYDRIVEYKGSIRPRSFVADLDALMLSLSEGGADAAATSLGAASGAQRPGEHDTAPSAEASRRAPRPKAAPGRVLAAAAVALAYAALFLGLALPRA